MPNKKVFVNRATIVRGDLVNTRIGTGLVIGSWKGLVLVAPTGRDGPYSKKVAYCEAWPEAQLVRRGWRDKAE